MKAFDKWFAKACPIYSGTENERWAKNGWIAAHNHLMVPSAAMLIASLIAGMLLGYAKAYSVRHEPRTVYVFTNNHAALAWEKVDGKQ